MKKILEWLNNNIGKLQIEYGEDIVKDMDSQLFRRTYQTIIKDSYILNAHAICGLGEHEGTCYGCEVEVITPKGCATFNDSEEGCESEDIYNTLADRYEKQKEEIRNDFLNSLD